MKFFCDHDLRLASMKLPLQLNESAIGVIDASSQDRGDVDACELVLCKKRLVSEVKLGRLQGKHIRGVGLIQENREFAKHGARFGHVGDLDAVFDDRD